MVSQPRPKIENNPILFCKTVFLSCSRIESPAVQSFLKNDYVDIWGHSPDGRLDIRVKKSLYESAGVTSECSVVDDIENIVQMSENITSTGAKAEWFEEYVSSI